MRTVLRLFFVSLVSVVLLIFQADPARTDSAARVQIPGANSISRPDRGDLPVCFWSAGGPVCVERTVEPGAARPGLEDRLAALLAGPTPQEQARGLWSAIPGGTALKGVEMQSGGRVVVRLDVPPEALEQLEHGTFEILVRQIGGTLEPLGWQDLRIETWNPVAGRFVPLADFLPPIPAPRKEAGPDEEGLGELAPAFAGQPPASGQGRPTGALSGKGVYVSAGHGWQWNGYGWRVQRIPYPRPPYVGPIIEDHNNAEAVNQYLLQYLWNAGADVWPVRERDMNAAEVVVDNDAPASATGYTETGTWATTAYTGTGYAGTDYRWTETVAHTPTATAVWTATLPADGRYAVYVWYRSGPNRIPDAPYTIHHAGGATEVVVDQRRHGLTWHYVGSYGFRADDDARITLTNRSQFTQTRAVIADAVRFGGGTFDDLTGIETEATDPPDKPWWEVAAYYYVQRMGMEQPPGDVTARPIYARWEHAGSGDDAVYVSWHTNGYSGYQWDYRGTMSIIHNGKGNPVTPGSELLRDAIHGELVGDIRAGWDPTWPEYKRSMNLGELRELWDEDPAARIPGALIEVAYHDHPDDTDALKEPAFQLLAARAFYQGILRYFEQRDGIDLTELPEPPTHLAVENVGGGRVRVSWRPSPTDTLGLVGDAATGYRVYTSTNGIGWSDGVPVTATTAYTLTDLVPGRLLFVRVTATNAGGESFPTETLGARVGDGSEVLLVNGFDRLNRAMAVLDEDPVEGENMRLLLDRMNRYDYVIQHGEPISHPFDSASNEAVQAGRVALGDYALVDWILGEESAAEETLDATERALLEAFLDGGGALFISGTEIGWHLDHLETDPDFYNAFLRADYVGDDAETTVVTPTAGSAFEGLGSFHFDAAGAYDPDFPDRIAPAAGAIAALTYQGGAGGTAAVQYADGCERLIHFGFPFETIWPDERAAVMGRVLDFLDECLDQSVETSILTPTYGSAHNALPAFEGVAESSGAELLGVAVQIERTSDGRHWADGSWVTETTWLTAAGAAAWSYALPPLDDGDYRLRARARATGGIADESPAQVVFTYDTVPPGSTTLVTPTGGVVVPPSAVRLEWEPVEPDGGASLAYVVGLDGQYYAATQSIYTVTQVIGGLHTWGVQVVDAAGNPSDWVTDTFSVGQYYVWLPVVMRGFEASPGVCVDVVVNGGFETDEGWLLNRAAYKTDASLVYSGVRSAQVGIPPGEPGGGGIVYSSVRQQVSVPTGSTATLRLWVYPISEGGDTDDQHYVTLFDEEGAHHVLDLSTTDGRAWVEREYDLSAYMGQTVTLYVGAKNDGDDDTAALYADDVILEVCP